MQGSGCGRAPGKHGGHELAAAAHAELVERRGQVLLDGVAEMCSSSTICRVECPLMTSATTRDCAPVSPYALSSSELICAAGVGSTMPI
jgi:hypothetical protein